MTAIEMTLFRGTLLIASSSIFKWGCLYASPAASSVCNINKCACLVDPVLLNAYLFEWFMNPKNHKTVSPAL